jgi:single-strand DNA-binding protein
MGVTNYCRFIGRLGQEPELEFTPGGHAKLKMRLAVKERKRVDDEWENVTTWVRLLAFGNNAENIEEYASKGDLIAFDTHFEERTWEDDEGKHWIYDFIVERWDIQHRVQREEYDGPPEEEEEGEVEEAPKPTLEF